MIRPSSLLSFVSSFSSFATFDGGHDWLPAAAAEEAIAWLELQAMKSERRPRDEGLINEWFEQSVSRARAAEAAGKSYEAYIRFNDAASDFKGLRDVAEQSLTDDEDPVKNDKGNTGRHCQCRGNDDVALIEIS